VTGEEGKEIRERKKLSPLKALLPGVGFGGGTAGSGEDFIQAFQEIFGEGQIEGAHGAI